MGSSKIGAAMVAATKILLYKMLCVKKDPNNSNTNNYNNTTQPSNSESLLPSSSSMPDIPASSNLLSSPSVEYEVFLSFRGPDTRELFTDILYRNLIRTKIRTFKDDDELPKGEGIWPNLAKAIDQSKIYVPIISETYAQSKWCLKELAEIVKHHKEDQRRLILPIFYMVEPREIKKSEFQQYESHFDEKTIQSWKDALNFLRTLKGYVVKDLNQVGHTIDEVYAAVWSRLSKDNLIVHTDELVGIDNHIHAVTEQLNLDANKDLTMVGIHGLGGIGKTTIAKAVYNSISSRFDRCCFLEDVRGKQGQHDGNVILQKKLISDILKMHDVEITDENGGRKMIRERVCRHKVLIVLDDVDGNFRFDDILGNPKDFFSGSRFVVTSRNTKILGDLNDSRCKLYEVGTMDHPHSLELFSKHAFKTNCPPLDYKDISNKIVATTAGLPLTLKVYGCFLFREDISTWEEKLVKVQKIPDVEVMERLKISYDTLPEEAQEIFLDIACFFIGTSKELPCYMWSDCDYFPICNVNILVQRSMLKVGGDDRFQMHDQHRDMGREIVRRENTRHLGKRSRIWSDKDALELLSSNKEPTRVKAIRVNSSSIVMEELNSDCFKNLLELRYLDAPSTKLTGDFNNLLPQLRWLRLPKHKNGSVSNIRMKSLVILELQTSQVDDKWDGLRHIKMAEKLKVLNLANCKFLSKIPAFPGSGSLEIFHQSSIRKNSQGLQELDLDKLRKLTVLILRSSNVSRINGGTIGMVEGLRELDLSFLDSACENWREALSDIWKLSRLEILRHTFEDTNPDQLLKLPLSLKELETSSHVPNLEEMLRLEKLALRKSEHGLDIPDPSSSLWWKESKLKVLSLLTTKINTCSPSSLLPSSLTEIKINDCRVPVSMPNLENLENLTQLSIIRSYVRGEILGLGGLKSLKSLNIQNVQGLTRIRGLDALTASLEKVSIYYCTSLQLDIGLILPHMSKFSRLRILELGDAISSSDDQVLAVPSFEELTDLSIYDLKSTQKLILRSMMPKLEYLYLIHMPNMKEIEGLGELKSLRQILLMGCESLAKFELSCLQNLEALCIDGGCRGLERLPFSIANLVNLQRLRLKNLPSLREIAGKDENIEGLKCLKELDLEGCTALKRLPADQMIDQLEELRSVNIVGCTNLNVDQLVALTNPRKRFEVHGPRLNEWYNLGDEYYVSWLDLMLL
ncbi:Disease resistance protein L6 [Linum grandiflorum]